MLFELYCLNLLFHQNSRLRPQVQPFIWLIARLHVSWTLNLHIIVFFISIPTTLTCKLLIVFTLFICHLMSTINFLLNLLNVLLWVIICHTKVMFAMIHVLTDFAFLIMLFSLKINFSSLLMLSLCQSNLFFLILLRLLLFLNDLSLDLCINDTKRPSLQPQMSFHNAFSELNVHLMGMDSLIHLFTLLMTTVPISSCYSEAIKHDCWHKVMEKELQSLVGNHTWDIVHCPANVKPIGCKWVYLIKLCYDGTIDHYKAWLVALGNKQDYGINYEDDNRSNGYVHCCLTRLATSLDGC